MGLPRPVQPTRERPAGAAGHRERPQLSGSWVRCREARRGGRSIAMLPVLSVGRSSAVRRVSRDSGGRGFAGQALEAGVSGRVRPGTPSNRVPSYRVLQSPMNRRSLMWSRSRQGSPEARCRQRWRLKVRDSFAVKAGLSRTRPTQFASHSTLSGDPAPGTSAVTLALAWPRGRGRCPCRDASRRDRCGVAPVLCYPGSVTSR
jgi:hypothetical protein